MSHSPLLNLPGPSAELLDDINAALSSARDFVREFDPELVITFSPDEPDITVRVLWQDTSFVGALVERDARGHFKPDAYKAFLEITPEMH